MRKRLAIGMALAVVLNSSAAFAGHLLIKDDEAQLPPPKFAVADSRRGVTRSPNVTFVPDGQSARSPFHFQVKFTAFGGSTIDPKSLKITYFRTPNVDLTSRVVSFALPSGIDIPDAEAPAGEHTLRVDIKDSEGRIGTAIFVLAVAP